MTSGGSGGGASPIADSGSDGSDGPSRDASPECSTGSRVLVLSFSQYPELAKVGGNVRVPATGYTDPNCGPGGNIIVIQDSLGHYVALSTSCPHACCEVNFVAGCAWAFTCPCHGALFDVAGKSAGIKTTLPLPSLPVCADANGVSVTLA
jgi:Rieske Fe-S protein